MAGFKECENAQIAKMIVLSEMQLASSLSELDAQDKTPSGQRSTNSGWDKEALTVVGTKFPKIVEHHKMKWS